MGTTPAGQEINLKGVKPTKERLFISDILPKSPLLGFKLVDADASALAQDVDFRPPPSCMAPAPPDAEAVATLLSRGGSDNPQRDQGLDPATDAPTAKSD